MHSFEIIYCALSEEISFAESQVNDLMKTRSYLVKSMHAKAPSGIKTTRYDLAGRKSEFVPYDLDRIANKLLEVDAALLYWNEYLDIKQGTRERLDIILQRTAGIEWKLTFMRDKLHMRLHEIAEKLGYSYDHIKRVSACMKKPKTRRVV